MMRYFQLNTKAYIGMLFLALIVMFSACKKTQQFKDILDALPQISSEPMYAYKPAYAVGDTMVITGRLNSGKDLKITIGDAEAAVVKTTQVPYYYNSFPASNNGILDRVSIIINDKMGIGPGRQVTINSGGNTIHGAAIEIYTNGGNGSFSDSLKLVNLAAITSPNNIFLHCLNGKGDIYYFDAILKNLRRMKKDGTIEVALADTALTTDQAGKFQLISFVAGGVNPAGTTAYLSLTTANGYRFCKADLITGKIITLNTSANLRAPFEGQLSASNVFVNGIFPDSKGNIYVTVGVANGTKQAIARYNEASGTLKYLFRTSYSVSGMPGVAMISTDLNAQVFRFLPEEASLYVIAESGQGANGPVNGHVSVYSLESRLVIANLTPAGIGNITDPPVCIGPFATLKMEITGVSTLTNFGFLPMPGSRLQVLVYNAINSSVSLARQNGYPKWIVMDFVGARNYQYALGRCDIGDYSLRPVNPSDLVKDELLNYDEDGNLYMTANARKTVVKTQKK